MKKLVLTLLLISMSYTMQAQFSINGHTVPFDSQTNTWLATIAETLFGNDNQLTVSLQDRWEQITINDETVNGQYTFKQLTADSSYPATVTDADGHSLTGVIRFTFLPLIQLKGEFGYDYQDGRVIIAHPEHDADSSYTAKIKWRGGTTNAEGKHKRNYNIKFEKDVKLFDMRSDNNWMLDAGQPDVFRLRNRIAMDIWNDMAHKPYYADLEPKARNGVKGRVVEVFLNNEYRGIYNLSEKLDRKQMKLMKVNPLTSEIHGVLYKGISWNYTIMNDSIYQYDNHSETLYGYKVKYPDLNDNDTTDWKPLVDAINHNLILSYDDLEFEKQVSDWFDIPVLIDYSIFVSSINALDNNGKNTFWAVYDKSVNHQLTLAPWDLDCTFGQRWGSLMADAALPNNLVDVTIGVLYNFYRTNALQFNDRLNLRYKELRQEGNVLSTDSLISRVTKYYQALKKSGAAQRETAKWSGDSDVWGDTIDFDKEYDYICNWITQHMQAIDKKGFPLQYDDNYFERLTTIKSTINKYNLNNKYIYTLSGQRVQNTKPLRSGIYIVNGKKIVIK